MTQRRWPDDLCQTLMHSFALGSGHGLLRLGSTQFGRILPPPGPDGAMWRCTMSPLCVPHPKVAI